MELKPNMYVRTKSGIIAKIIGTRINPLGKETIYVLDKEINIDELEMGDLYITTNPLSDDMTNIIDTHFGDERILSKEPSYNIIDLIEVGDIVKLFMEDDIDKEDTNIFELVAVTIDKKQLGVFNSDFQIEFFPIENLRGILTKEQFSQMEYKVEQ